MRFALDLVKHSLAPKGRCYLNVKVKSFPVVNVKPVLTVERKASMVMERGHYAPVEGVNKWCLDEVEVVVGKGGRGTRVLVSSPACHMRIIRSAVTICPASLGVAVAGSGTPVQQA